MSSIPAPTAPSAAPVDTPWTTRADHQLRHAVRGREHDHRGCLGGDCHQQHRSPAEVVGQPSEGQEATSTAIAYTPKTTVVVTRLNPHSGW